MRNPFRYFNSLPDVIRLAVMMYTVSNSPGRRDAAKRCFFGILQRFDGMAALGQHAQAKINR